MSNEIVLFKSENSEVVLPVSIEDETVWLSANQMAILFERDEKTIRKHINNVFNEFEVDKERNTQKMRVANSDKLVPFYSLDVIISVGYRVKSKRGVEFRRWANEILKKYILDGIAINDKRLKILNRTVEIQNNLIAGFAEIAGMEAKDVLEVIESYSMALNILDDYDHQKVTKPLGQKAIAFLSENYCNEIVNSMDHFGKSALFGKEREKGMLKGILDQIKQNVFGQELYPSMEEKAANLLYMLVKDHIYYDGNKRIAAVLFLEFLNQNRILFDKESKCRLSNSSLVAITLMIACSKPEEKDIFVNIVMNLLLENMQSV